MVFIILGQENMCMETLFEVWSTPTFRDESSSNRDSMGCSSSNMGRNGRRQTIKIPIKESALTNRCLHQLESLNKMESTDGMSELLKWKFSIIILRAV